MKIFPMKISKIGPFACFHPLENVDQNITNNTINCITKILNTNKIEVIGDDILWLEIPGMKGTPVGGDHSPNVYDCIFSEI
jgi:hypothetical protein